MFNLALLLQYSDAADYWRHYLSSDCQTEWATRARRSLKFCEMQASLYTAGQLAQKFQRRAKVPTARPVVCFDESPIQLIGEVRSPIPAKPGQLERCDCEYRRNGTANLFVFLDVHRPWRKVKVTTSRAAVDFAVCMRELAEVHLPAAERIRVVLDNLSTHSAGALYQTFPPDEARRVLRRLEFHYVPKHASWLNMVEIEIGVLAAQCLDRRIGSIERLTAETAAWEQQRNGARARIKWMFTTDKPAPKWLVPIRSLRLTQVTFKESKPLCRDTSAFDAMVLAQGLGDADRQAPRHEKSDCRAGATVGGDYASHLG